MKPQKVKTFLHCKSWDASNFLATRKSTFTFWRFGVRTKLHCFSKKTFLDGAGDSHLLPLLRRGHFPGPLHMQCLATFIEKIAIDSHYLMSGTKMRTKETNMLTIYCEVINNKFVSDSGSHSFRIKLMKKNIHPQQSNLV